MRVIALTSTEFDKREGPAIMNPMSRSSLQNSHTQLLENIVATRDKAMNIIHPIQLLMAAQSVTPCWHSFCSSLKAIIHMSMGGIKRVRDIAKIYRASMNDYTCEVIS